VTLIVDGVCRPVEQAPQPHRWRCLACSHQVTAMTERAAVEGLDAHQHYAHSGELKIVRGADDPGTPVVRTC
jgi:hypothetical protein